MEVLPSKMGVSPPTIGFLSLAPKLLAEAVHFVPGPGGGWLPGYRLELHLIRNDTDKYATLQIFQILSERITFSKYQSDQSEIDSQKP